MRLARSTTMLVSGTMFSVVGVAGPPGSISVPVSAMPAKAPLNATSSLEFFPGEGTEVHHAIPRESGYGLSLHPDGLRLAVAGFVNNGRGGNGRHAKPAEYVAHKGALVIYRLDEKKTT